MSVVDSGGETPGPIPNPEAKPARADGTAPGREWESRLPPTQQLHTQTPVDETKPSFIYGCFHVYPDDCCRRQQQHWCPPTSPQYGAGTVRASLCHRIVVGVYPLVRNAESECLQCGINDKTGVTMPLHSQRLGSQPPVTWLRQQNRWCPPTCPQREVRIGTRLTMPLYSWCPPTCPQCRVRRGSGMTMPLHS